MHVMSYKMWCDVIKYGCDALYRLSDIVHIVGVLSYLERVWYHWTSGNYDTDPVALMSYTMDMMSCIIAEVISEIQFVWIINTVDVMTHPHTVDTMLNIVGVMTLTRWFEVISPLFLKLVKYMLKLSLVLYVSYTFLSFYTFIYVLQNGYHAMISFLVL